MRKKDFVWPLKGKQVETDDEAVEMLSVSSDSSVVCVCLIRWCCALFS